MSIHNHLVWYVLGFATIGFLLPDATAFLHSLVPLMLAGQVIGVALTLTAGEFTYVVKRVWVLLAALAVQWICFPAVGLTLLHLMPDKTVGRGALIISVAPAEITSALIAITAGGNGALTVSCMVGSLALSTVLTPVWLTVALGRSGHIDGASLVTELLFSVLLPLCAGMIVRTVWPAIKQYQSRCLDLAAISVILVVFVGAGSMRDNLHPRVAPEALIVCLVLVLAGMVLGAVTAFLLRLRPADHRAVFFPVGMREFGVATAVAIVVAPASTGVAGLYGVLLMAGSSVLAARLAHAPPHER